MSPTEPKLRGASPFLGINDDAQKLNTGGRHTPRGLTVQHEGKLGPNLRQVLGLPKLRGSIGNVKIPSEKRPCGSTVSSAEPSLDQFDCSKLLVEETVSTMEPTVTSRADSRQWRPGLSARGCDDIADLQAMLGAWSGPKKGGRQLLGPLIVEAEEFGAELEAFRNNGGFRLSVQFSAALHLDSVATARAASLCLKIIRTLPGALGTCLGMLVQCLLEAIYRDWQAGIPAHELSEDNIRPDVFLKHLAFHEQVGGAQAKNDHVLSLLAAEKREVERLKERVKPLEDELRSARLRIKQLEERAAIAEKRADEESKRAQDALDEYQTLKSQVKHIHEHYDALLHTQHENEIELRGLASELQEAKLREREQKHIITELSVQRSETERKYDAIRHEMQHHRHDLEQLPQLKEQLKLYLNDDAAYGIGLASKIAWAVYNVDLDQLLGKKRPDDFHPRKTLKCSSHGQKADSGAEDGRIDALVMKLKEFPKDIQSLKWKLDHSQRELKHCKELIPIWNADEVEDIALLYDVNLEGHREVFSMKDTRNFVGLGLGANVPPYLRYDGLIRHLFVSKSELEQFMQEFLSSLQAPSEDYDKGTTPCMDVEYLHNELHSFLKQRYDSHEALLEFSYAFMSGLGAYYGDPDFELFDLILTGVLHPSITQDQKEMLDALEALLQSCHEGPVPSSGAANYQVNRRIVQASLKATFPWKSNAHHNDLRRALALTLQTLEERGICPMKDCVFVAGLFSEYADGTQTPFIETIRKQHTKEVVQFLVSVTRNFAEECTHLGSTSLAKPSNLQSALMKADDQLSRAEADQLVKAAFASFAIDANRGCPDALCSLRCHTLLRPSQLWFRAKEQDVVHVLLNRVQSEGAEVASDDKLHQPRRIRAAKVIENPFVAAGSTRFASMDGLMRALDNVKKTSNGFEEDLEEAR